MAVATEWLEKDYYDILGLPENSSDAAIRKHYRKVVRTAHPDVNPDDATAEARFKEISAAYDVLGDAKKRKEYDEMRELARRSPYDGGGRPGGFRAQTGSYEDLGDLDGFDDIFANLFGGGRATYQSDGRPRPRPGNDRGASLSLPFVDAVYGTSSNLKLSADPTAKAVKVRIPAGVEDGQTIRIAGKGEPGHAGGPAGDLYVTLEVEPHPEFGRVGRHLTLNVPVTFSEAALGAKVTVPTLDGSTVTVRVPAGTSAGSKLRVAQKGVPGSPPGDLLLIIDIDVPTDLTPEERDLVEQLAAQDRPNPRANWAA